MEELFKSVPDDQEALKALKLKFGNGESFDVDRLAMSKLESDRFIQRLQAENEEIRKEVSAKLTMDEILTKIKEQSSQQAPINGNPPQMNQEPNIDNSKIESLVDETFRKREQERQVEQNKNLVREKLEAVYGVDTNLQLSKKAKELNVTVQDLYEIALKSPNVFFATIGLNNEAQSLAKMVAPRSNSTLQKSGGDVRNNSYYERLKATDKAKYFSVEVQKQMYKDAIAQGASFYDN